MSRAGSDFLEPARELAGLMGRAALSHFRQRLTVEHKRDDSPVTIADREAERIGREWIASRFPDDAVLGEEFGETPGQSGRRWLLDPVDGTRTFIRGVPLWGSLVALIEGGSVLAGAASFPALGEEIAAAPGKGCWSNGSRCDVSVTGILSEATVLTTDMHAFGDPFAKGWQRLAAAAGTVRTWGDCYGYLLIATGRAEVMVDARLSAWDSACFLPIIREAGGVITGLGGETGWDLPHAIATNAGTASAARECFVS